MLDDLKYIHERDAQDALGIAEKQWQQLTHEFSLEFKPNKITNIVFAGMGGSALAAEISLSWPSYKLPFHICRDYEIPKHVGPETLFIASSYSGNTEETISALEHAVTRKAQIVIIASGGKLHEIAKQKNYPFELLPKVGQPRFATFYSLKALVTILEKTGLLATEAANKELGVVADFLQKATQNWLPTVPSSKNQAKQIAQEIMGTSAVIYAGPLLFPAAYKWKISINENSKNIAWCSHYPEFNHNEITGWASHPVDKPYTVIDLRSSLDNPQIQKRFELSTKLLSGKRPHPETINAEGKTDLQQLLWTILLGDFVSLYLALLNGINPTPVDIQDKLKTGLKAE